MDDDAHTEHLRQHDEILRSLTAMLAAQHAMNQRQVEINNDVKTTLARIETMSTVPRGEDSWQTQNNTVPSGADTRQTENETVPSVPTVGKEPTPVVQHSWQTVMSPESLGEPENASATLVRQPTKRTTRARLDADDLEDMPLEPETASAALVRQTEKSPMPLTVGTPSDAPPPVVPGPDFNPLVYWLQPPRVCGHASHGAAGNLTKRSTGKCKRCEDAKAAQKKAEKHPSPRA